MHLAVGHARLDPVRQVRAFATGAAVYVRLPRESDLGSGALVEAELLRLQGRSNFDVGLLWAAIHACTASRTSFTVIRPSAPEPSISSRSMPSSCAAFSAAGVALCFSARRCRRRSPSSLALRAAAVPRSFASSEAAEPIS